MTPASRASRPDRQTVVQASEGGLGTFGGVFTPSILTILGVIMYLRLGWVVGNVGLASTLVIVTLSTAITFLTALSVAAIATDQRVRTGGAYYMISRSLGIEVGGAVGIPLYIAQALSIALYTVGFAESVARVFPSLDEKAVGLIVTVLVALLALWSTHAAIRAQYVIMAAIALSLVSLLLGSPIEPTAAAPGSPPELLGFWPVFAVFFPAVTGIMAGVNMSGDLKDPARSIPWGTFAAVGVGYVIYMTLPVVLYLRADQASLLSDPLVMRRIAFWGDAILLGVWGATLSSAMGSILGAPRVLQALARDRVLPRPLRWLGRGSGVEDTPRAGTLVTLGVALAAVWLGNLNVIAPILTMFFLTTYGVMNVAAGVEQFVRSPSFRPTFRVHWSLSLLGAVGCAGVMLVLNPGATIAAGVFVGGVFVWLRRRELRVAWGDVRQGLWLAITRAGLLRIESKPDPKNWRPHILVLAGSPMRRWHLIDLANAFTHNRALLSVCTIVPPDSVDARRRSELEKRIEDYLAGRAVNALARVVAADDPFAGAQLLVQTYGLGRLVPNTILLGGSEREEGPEGFCRMVRYFHASRRNVVIYESARDPDFGRNIRIAVWWRGQKGNGGLMVILAYLLQTSTRWRSVDVHVRMVVPPKAPVPEIRESISSRLRAMRIDASVDVLPADGRSQWDVLAESSRDCDLVMLGMAEPGDDFTDYYVSLRERLRDLPPCVLVLAAEEIGFGEVLK